LSAFVGATKYIDQPPPNFRGGNDRHGAQTVDTEAELLDALNAIEGSVAKFGNSSALQQYGDYEAYDYQAFDADLLASNPNAPVIIAAKKLADATATLMGATAQTHKAIKQKDPNVYRKDPNWATGVATAARAVAENTSQLVEISCDPTTSTEEIVAAARCVNSSAETLVNYTRAKTDSNSPEQQQLESASRGIAKATNFLVEMAKQVHHRNAATAVSDLSTIRTASRSKQLDAEFEAQTEIARLEAELEAARDYLFKFKRSVYG